MELFDSERDRGHFLHELGADERRQRAPAGPGDERTTVVGGNAELGLEATEKLERLLGLLRLVTLIVGPDDGVGGGVDRNRLDRRRAHVDSNEKLRCHRLPRRSQIDAPRRT